ncbi:MAG: hypothetical protein LBC88_01450 [Spirochaetaceae bacterium]|jgi:hypothetical protein|nr:hypothetical protein [Spirochaetaceae bacterium]
MSRAVLIALGALFIALPGLFTSCPMEMETGPINPANFYGDWISSANADGGRYAYDISETTFKLTAIGTPVAPATFSIGRWDPRRNPYFGEMSGAYPSGYRILSTGGGFKRILYMHTNKQTFLEYLGDDNPDAYIVFSKRAPAGDDGVPKRITITGIPTASFTGGQRGAQIEVKNNLGETVARVQTTQHALQNTLTFNLKKTDGSGADWTGAGDGYTVRFLILAANYNGVYNGMEQFHFMKYDAAFSGAELIIPFERSHWGFWDPNLE